MCVVPNEIAANIDAVRDIELNTRGPEPVDVVVPQADVVCLGARGAKVADANSGRVATASGLLLQTEGRPDQLESFDMDVPRVRDEHGRAVGVVGMQTGPLTGKGTHREPRVGATTSDVRNHQQAVGDS